jgi:hypothetical protein
MKGDDMENDFEINDVDLNGEWLRQPVLYNKWATFAAAASRLQNQLELGRKVLKAQLYKEAKERFETAGKKPTGSDLEAEVRTNPEYSKISQELIEAEEKTALMDAGRWSMVEKGKALEQICSARDKGFFMPNGSKAISEVRQDQLKEVDRGLREEMNKKKINRG